MKSRSKPKRKEHEYMMDRLKSRAFESSEGRSKFLSGAKKGKALKRGSTIVMKHKKDK